MSLPHELWMPNTRRHLLPMIDHGPLDTVEFLVVHINEGSTGGTFSWWATPVGHNGKQEMDGAQIQVSQDGTVFQTVALNRKCWHAGDANGRSLGLEHEGMHLGRHPEVQLHASANRVGWLCHECHLGRPKLGHNVFPHAHGGAAWGGHPLCPGASWPWDHYMRLCMTAYMEHWGR